MNALCHNIAIEHQEGGGEALTASTESALARIDRLVEHLHSEITAQPLLQTA